MHCWLAVWCILHVAKVLGKVSFCFPGCFGCEVLASTEETYSAKAAQPLLLTNGNIMCINC